jgi:hypothetical protein
MIEGIFITLGAILIIASRFLYGKYDITLGGDNNNDAMGVFAVIADIVGTLMVVLSILSYNGIIKL